MPGIFGINGNRIRPFPRFFRDPGITTGEGKHRKDAEKFPKFLPGFRRKRGNPRGLFVIPEFPNGGNFPARNSRKKSSDGTGSVRLFRRVGRREFFGKRIPRISWEFWEMSTLRRLGRTGAKSEAGMSWKNPNSEDDPSDSDADGGSGKSRRPYPGFSLADRDGKIPDSRVLGNSRIPGISRSLLAAEFPGIARSRDRSEPRTKSRRIPGKKGMRFRPGIPTRNERRVKFSVNFPLQSVVSEGVIQ